MSIYTDIGLKRVVNASGRVTKFGVSTISDRVAHAAVKAAQSYVVIEDLYKRAGKLIASHTGGEDACVTSCASASVCLSIAGLITQGKRSLVTRMPDSSGLKNEIILQKGHAIEFGAPMETMIRLAGGVPVEVGTVNEVLPEEIEEAIGDDTVALMYVKSHHCVQKGMVDLETMIKIAHDHDLPLVVDAAAEEDLRKYVAMGADLVCYSGAKALEATTSGFITGKARYIEWARAQYGGIGRPMKVGKEQIMGLIEALDQYDERDHEAQARYNLETATWLAEHIAQVPGLNTEVIQDEAGRAIWRARVTVDPEAQKNGMTARKLLDALVNGDPCIQPRAEFINLGKIDFDPRPLVAGDKELIVKTLESIMEG